MTMDIDAMITQMNAHAPAAIKTLGGSVTSYDDATHTMIMSFHASEALCHSGDIVQGGFITGMIDATMSHAVFAAVREPIILPTLEIKVSFLEIARMGDLIASGTVVRLGKTVAFLEGQLRDSQGKLLASATSTARILRKKRDSGNRPPGEPQRDSNYQL
jgi:uncharacterized protein (TIGR00369 family)